MSACDITNMEKYDSNNGHAKSVYKLLFGCCNFKVDNDDMIIPDTCNM